MKKLILILFLFLIPFGVFAADNSLIQEKINFLIKQIELLNKMLAILLSRQISPSQIPTPIPIPAPTPVSFPTRPIDCYLADGDYVNYAATTTEVDFSYSIRCKNTIGREVKIESITVKINSPVTRKIIISGISLPFSYSHILHSDTFDIEPRPLISVAPGVFDVLSIRSELAEPMRQNTEIKISIEKISFDTKLERVIYKNENLILPSNFLLPVPFLFPTPTPLPVSSGTPIADYVIAELSGKPSVNDNGFGSVAIYTKRQDGIPVKGKVKIIMWNGEEKIIEADNFGLIVLNGQCGKTITVIDEVRIQDIVFPACPTPTPTPTPEPKPCRFYDCSHCSRPPCA